MTTALKTEEGIRDVEKYISSRLSKTTPDFRWVRIVVPHDDAWAMRRNNLRINARVGNWFHETYISRELLFDAPPNKIVDFFVRVLRRVSEKRI